MNTTPDDYVRFDKLEALIAAGFDDLRAEIGTLKTDVLALRTDVVDLRVSVDKLSARVDDLHRQVKLVAEGLGWYLRNCSSASALERQQ